MNINGLGAKKIALKNAPKINSQNLQTNLLRHFGFGIG